MTTAEKNTQLQIRCLISNVYDLQKLRISIGNRLVQSFYIQMGVAPSHKIDEADDVCKGILNSLAYEYELISERMIASKYSLKKQIAKIQKNGELQYIHNELDYKLVDEYMSMRKNENDTLKILAKYVHMHPLWNLFMYEELKNQVIAQGDDAINDLLGYEHANEPEHILKDMINDVLNQMPEEEALKFYHKYCM